MGGDANQSMKATLGALGIFGTMTHGEQGVESFSPIDDPGPP
jgi:hypothetical protein